MSTPTSKSDYMLLFRGTNWDKELSPDQLQKVVSDWYGWFEGLMKTGKAIGGYFYLQVANEEEAIAIAQQCPGLEYGCVVEVRPVADMCNARARAMEMETRGEQLAGVV